MQRQPYRYRGFTVIEVLVVVAIIALLVAILLPSLRAARLHAKTVVCGSNLHHIGLAVANYLFGSEGVYPASYVYPYDERGRWSVKEQQKSRPFGYLHWSHFMYSGGQVGPEAFQCPMFDHGGAPRTNPGRKNDDWEAGQVDQNGDARPNDLIDKQAPRMSYTANAAIMPRNKFTSDLSGGPRVNVFVRDSKVRRPGSTIVVTEFLNNWRAIGVDSGNGVLSKSHRPINPFYHVGGGFDEYKPAPQNAGFIYGLPQDQETYGLLPLREVRDKVNILDHTSGIPQINAVGRHHPAKDQIYAEEYGGESNFLFGDSHVEAMTPLESVQKRLWGDRYYSLSGQNQILNMTTVVAGSRRN